MKCTSSFLITYQHLYHSVPPSCRHFSKLLQWLGHQCLIFKRDFKRSSQNIIG